MSVPPTTRGHKKRARTRQLLIETARAVLAEQGEQFAIADIAARAGVSHGTFYNYFSDREALIEAVVPVAVEAFAARSDAEVAEPDPAERFALITARVLDRAVVAPDEARLMLRLNAVQRALLVAGPLSYLQRDLAQGCESGRFAGAADEATIDVVLGTLLMACRRIVEGDVSEAYRRTVIVRLLTGLGVDRGESEELAGRAVAPAQPVGAHP